MFSGRWPKREDATRRNNVARFYITKHEDGTIEPGDIVSTRWFGLMDNAVASIDRQLTDAPAGTYRATLSSQLQRQTVTIGKTIKSFSAEAARLQKAFDKRTSSATTGLPGIAGYQHMANMATSSLMTLNAETAALIKWLTNQEN